MSSPSIARRKICNRALRLPDDGDEHRSNSFHCRLATSSPSNYIEIIITMAIVIIVIALLLRLPTPVSFSCPFSLACFPETVALRETGPSIHLSASVQASTPLRADVRNERTRFLEHPNRGPHASLVECAERKIRTTQRVCYDVAKPERVLGLHFPHNQSSRPSREKDASHATDGEKLAHTVCQFCRCRRGER
ncbi:diguanylate cyclase [Anopheles sinensis]|uniref:Diguanylate cyclase n=1 Tax=Anopheles sinensis TaxID=74873 RepID=A0A084WJV8_ANOSI|nr:diguanylate cyclase [Anopheles sinensis]